MLIFRLPFGRPFSFSPAVFIPPDVTASRYEALLAHETAHYNRQGLFPIAWVVKYFTNKQFRLQEELIAVTAEINKYRELSIPVSLESYAKVLSTQYWNMVSYEDALLKLRETFI